MIEQERDDNRRFGDRARELLRSLPMPPAMRFCQPGKTQRTKAMCTWLPAAIAAIVVVAAAWFYPPGLVNGAWAHVEEEQSLHGSQIRDPQALYASLGLKDGRLLPGLVQLRKFRIVNGHRACHITTFIDGKGWVNILAFQECVIPRSSGG